MTELQARRIAARASGESLSRPRYATPAAGNIQKGLLPGVFISSITLREHRSKSRPSARRADTPTRSPMRGSLGFTSPVYHSSTS